MLRLWLRPLYFLLPLLVLSPLTRANEPGSWTLSVELHGKWLQGYPLRSTDKEISLLQRDGAITDFAPGQVSNFKQTSSTFRPFTLGELRAELQREFGSALEVSATGHYVVAHPKGQGPLWSDRFEDLYRSMKLYFSVRGLTMQEPEFPMAAIVWERREDFLRHAASTGDRLPPGVIGYYSPLSNRISLYDMAAGKRNPEAWQQNANTVVHEATHQTAFNTGLHRRLAETPRWVVEGLGTMFEPRGVWDSRRFPHLEDRINRERLDYFRQYLKSGRPAQGFLLLVADDELFRNNPLAAYAEAWAFTFYLMENLPKQYGQYLAKTAELEPFAAYGARARLADFRSVFGTNLRMLEANYLRFIESLR